MRQLLEQEKLRGRQHVLDPFAGSGTVLLEGEAGGLHAIGIEAHPLVERIARAKLFWREDPERFRTYALSLIERAQALTGNPTGYPRLIHACFPPASLSRLDTLRQAWQASADASPLSELAWLALCAILRDCSPVGTAQWQYVLPHKTKARALEPYAAFCARVSRMADDMVRRQRQPPGSPAILHGGDARDCAPVPDGWADLVITSPPYANNYDYADATRLELSFFGEVRDWSDLQPRVRTHLLRSCTQHVARLARETGRLLSTPLLEPIHTELADVCEQLEAEREKHAGKKPYHTVVAAYFSDMARVWLALRRVTCKGALVCVVIGDSAPYGIYVPVDRWLGELARAAGFTSCRFEKTRDRNVKWKNRKHRVPLHEGRLWVEG